MTCRIRHRWDGWHFVRCDCCKRTDKTRVWRMCRKCGADEETESATAATSMVAARLQRWRARMP